MDIGDIRTAELIPRLLNRLDETGSLARELELDESEKWDFFNQTDVDYANKETFESVLQTLAIDPAQDPMECDAGLFWTSIDKKVIFGCVNEMPNEHGYETKLIGVFGLGERVRDCISMHRYFS